LELSQGYNGEDPETVTFIKRFCERLERGGYILVGRKLKETENKQVVRGDIIVEPAHFRFQRYNEVRKKIHDRGIHHLKCLLMFLSCL
jgi:hypothetical protein